MLSGCLFLFTGAHKIWSWEFAGIEFPNYFDQEDQDQVEEIADQREPTSIARQRAPYPGRRGGSARAG